MPEGGTTCGPMINFKKGAFASETSMKPMAIKYHAPFVSPITGIIDGVYYYVHLMGCIFCTVTIYEMPTFRPNDFFWETHCKEGDSRWKVFATTIREIIHEGGGIPYAEEETWIE